MINRQIAIGGTYMRVAGICLLTLGGGIVIASSVVLASPSQSSQAQTPPAQQKANSQFSRLPDGPGKETLIKVCGKCHSPMNVIANGQSREGWENEITKMAGLGATASDEEFTEILDYVTKNFPPSATKLNINKATAAEIETQLGLSSRQAEDIVAYREKNGDFKTLEDIKKVPQLEAKEVDVRRNRITFQ